jgi:hypothetical protein
MQALPGSDVTPGAADTPSRRRWLTGAGSLAATGLMAACVQVQPGQGGLAPAGARLLGDLRRRARTSRDARGLALLERAARVVPGFGHSAPVLLEAPVQAAFVLPGGIVGAFTGLLEVVNRPGELAGLLALGQAQLDTGGVAARLAQADLSVAQAFGVAWPEAAGTGGAAGTGLQRTFGSASIGAAEAAAVVRLAGAGIDPRVLIRLWDRLQAAATAASPATAVAFAAMALDAQAAGQRAQALARLGYRA